MWRFSIAFLFVKLVSVYFSDSQSTDTEGSAISKRGEVEPKQKEV